MTLVTRPSPNLTGGSEVYYILFKSTTLQLLQYDTGDAGLSIRMSDHRLVLVSFLIPYG